MNRNESPSPRWRAGNWAEASSFAKRAHSTNRGQRAIDFRAVNSAALACLGPVVWRLAPGGKVIAGEYVAFNPRRADKTPGSVKVRFLGQRAGVWSDFAIGAKGGDVASLCAYPWPNRKRGLRSRLARAAGTRRP
jgi:hypothetical protein